MVSELNKENFEEKIKEGLCIVDFWAPWCGPCKMLGPIYEEVSKDYEGKLKFYKLNTEENGDISQSRNVMGIPCLIVFNMGEEVDRITGFLPKEKLKEKIDAALKKV